MLVGGAAGSKDAPGVAIVKVESSRVVIGLAMYEGRHTKPEPECSIACMTLASLSCFHVDCIPQQATPCALSSYTLPNLPNQPDMWCDILAVL